MTNPERQSWEQVRVKGRDRFLLLGVARGAWVVVGGVVVEIVCWVFTRKIPEPLVATAARWVLLGIGTGALQAWLQWNARERAYHNSEDEGRH